MTKVKNKAVKYNKNAEALLTFGLPFSYNHRRRPVRRKNNHLPPGSPKLFCKSASFQKRCKGTHYFETCK